MIERIEVLNRDYGQEAQSVLMLTCVGCLGLGLFHQSMAILFWSIVAGWALRKTNRQMNEVTKLLDENREKLKPIEKKEWEEKYRQEVDSKREIERARHEAYMRSKGADLHHPLQVPVGKRLVAHPVQHGKGGHVYRLLGAATYLDSILHPDPEMFSLERWDQEQRCWFPVEGEEFGQLSVPKVEISIRTGGPNVSYDLADKIGMPYGDL